MKFHRIFSEENIAVADIPWKDDDNQGLPDWFFDGGYFEFTIDPEKDLVEWVPAMGPAPCWSAKFSSFPNDAAMVETFEAWAKAMY